MDKNFCFKIYDELQKNNFKVYFVGGCVRDFLIQNKIKSFKEFLEKKNLDIDITTNAIPKQIKKIFPQEKFLEIGESFNVCIIVKNKFKYEIATFRGEENYDGRKPKKVFVTDEIEDVKRRDFTINGLLYDYKKKKIIDYVNGEKDIKNKIIQTIGNPKKRFCEDYLRMLRAIRFSSQKKFEIEKETLKQIKINSNKIKKISKERIKYELDLILKNNNCEKYFLVLKNTNLLKNIFCCDLNLKNLNKTKNIFIKYSLLFYKISNFEKILFENKFTKKEIKIVYFLVKNLKNNLSKKEIIKLIENKNIELFFEFTKIIKEKKFEKIEKFYLKIKKNKKKFSQLKKFTILNGENLLKKGISGKKIGKKILDEKIKYFYDNIY